MYHLVLHIWGFGYADMKSGSIFMIWTALSSWVATKAFIDGCDNNRYSGHQHTEGDDTINGLDHKCPVMTVTVMVATT